MRTGASAVVGLVALGGCLQGCLPHVTEAQHASQLPTPGASPIITDETSLDAATPLVRAADDSVTVYLYSEKRCRKATKQPMTHM